MSHERGAGEELGRRPDSGQRVQALSLGPSTVLKRRFAEEQRLAERVRWMRRLPAVPRARGARGRVVNFPNYNANPYQTLMASALRRPMIPTSRLAQAIALIRLGHAHLLHIHWDEAFVNGFPAGAEQAAADDFVRRLEAHHARGGRFLWTLHNAAPHDWAEGPRGAHARVRAAIADLASVVHVHGDQSRDYLIETFGIAPAKIVVIEHPSYLGWYDAPALDRAPDADGRRRLLHFGRIRGYKGIDILARAIAGLAHPERVADLHLAGHADAGFDPAIFSGAPTPLRTTLRFIADDETPAVFAAADFSLLAYSRAMTSGSAALSLTFGVPVIAPDIDSIRAALPPALAPFLYEPSDPAALAAAIDRATAISAADLTDLRRTCLDFARARSPQRQAGQLAAACRSAGLLDAASLISAQTDTETEGSAAAVRLEHLPTGA